jgi:tetratricopeptide (TPR) repeat protein
MSPMRLGLAVLALAVFFSTLRAEDQGYASYTTEKLIDELAAIDRPAPGLAGLALYQAFIVEDAEPTFTMGVLGAPTPPVPPQMRELVRRGVEALPLLIQHLSDNRATRLSIGADGPGFMFMFRHYGAEYDPRHREPGQRPDPFAFRKGKSFSGAYTVKVGDVCYVLIGQIVNRRLTAMHYQPTGGLVVNSPLEVPSLIESVKQDWVGLDAQAHEASLLDDMRAGTHIFQQAPALRRLRFYYRERYSRLEAEDLYKKQEFEAGEAGHGRQAALYLNSKEYSKAAGEWSKWIAMAPHSADGYSGRGQALAKAGQIAEAIQDYTSAIALEKRPGIQRYILSQRAIAYADLGDADLAIADFKEIVRLFPKEALAYKDLADFLDNQGRSALAIEYFTKAIELNPKLAMLYLDRGIAYRRSGNPDRAMEDFARAIELNPRDAETYNSRALALKAMGRLEEALAEVSKAAELDPKGMYIVDTRAHILLGLNRAEEAAADFSAAIETGKTNPITFYGRGRAWEKLGSLEEAVADYQRCLEMPAKNSDDRESQEKARARLKLLAP